MITITPDHINRLITLEAEIRYDQPPDAGDDPYITIENEAQVIISAPHGARTCRKSDDQIWHEEDEYTAGMALLLGELCNVPVIATNKRIDGYDPNYTKNPDVPYKRALARMIDQYSVRFVIDLHGAALYSTNLDPNQTIDLGLRQAKAQIDPSMEIPHVEKLERMLCDTTHCDSDCFVVGRNKFPAASKGTISTFCVNQRVVGSQKSVQAIQIEMKPQVRIARRFPSATLYKSCGPYQAKSENVIHMIQSLAGFIEYLKVQE